MTASDFWSRRKAQVQAEEAATLAKAEQADIDAQEAALAEKSDAEILTELDLPDPDTLTEGDDFKVFLTKAVPARIRTRALRCLWRVNPVLANLDGLIDYGQDFTDANTVVENMQTAYQVGKGMLKHVEEMARQAELVAAESTETDAAEIEDDPAPDDNSDTNAIPEDALLAQAADLAPAPIYVAPAFEADDEEAPQPPRRMRFSFAEAAPTQ